MHGRQRGVSALNSAMASGASRPKPRHGRPQPPPSQRQGSQADQAQQQRGHHHHSIAWCLQNRRPQNRQCSTQGRRSDGTCKSGQNCSAARRMAHVRQPTFLPRTLQTHLRIQISPCNCPPSTRPKLPASRSMCTRNLAAKCMGKKGEAKDTWYRGNGWERWTEKD